ncbi:hypothetical protein Pcinc_017247 [Petrolisthes cinctipes]|uniref:Uncharacterized protein n=1 Tax=Petrolisthes cinctipes TaxID=88211 RepID=A0AAE1FR37_PETCI|nr:hypothetical protein Pcinc_017247 [Petrolisthes cinctipes]
MRVGWLVVVRIIMPPHVRTSRDNLTVSVVLWQGKSPPCHLTLRTRPTHNSHPSSPYHATSPYLVLTSPHLPPLVLTQSHPQVPTMPPLHTYLALTSPYLPCPHLSTTSFFRPNPLPPPSPYHATSPYLPCPHLSIPTLPSPLHNLLLLS